MVALSLPIQILLIALVAVYRIIAATLLRALYAVSPLLRRRMVEDAPEGSLLEHILEQPQHLNMTLQFWNQTLLVLLLILLWPFRETLGSGWMLVAIMFVYIWIMDIVLPAVIISGNPSLWIERLFHLCSPIHKMLSPLLAPLVEKSQCSTERNGEEEIAPTEEAMTAFLEEGEAEGILEEEDSELIRNVVGFGDTIVREVMTPRTRIQGIADTATLEEVWDAFRVQRNSRMPVYNNTIDNIQGVLLLKDFIQLHGQDDADWISLARQPIFVPESKSTLELLRELQLARTQMAIVVDEYGAVAGLATVEDLLEEVVGEIQEEHEFSPVLHESSPGVYNVPGETHVEDLSAALGMELEHEGFDTVAGLVMSKLGRIPNPLETVHVDGLILRVMKMDGTRIVMVEVRSK